MKPDLEFSKSFEELTIIHHNQPMMEYDEHNHDFSECIIPLFGNLVLSWETDRPQETLTPRRMIFIPSACGHAASSPDRQGERLILLVDSRQLALEKPLNLPRHQIIVELCFELLDSDDAEENDLAKKLLIKILNRVAHDRDHQQLVATKDLVASVEDERLKCVLDVFQTSLGIEAKMSDIAKTAGLSERSMQRLFKAELGMTPNSVLSLYRIEKAIHLLQGGQSVTYAALEVGYLSLSQFSAQFKAITGRIPSDFIG